MASALFISGTNGTKLCIDPTSVDYACVTGASMWQTWDSDTPECENIGDSDLADLTACFDVIGRLGIKKVQLSANPMLTTLPDDMFEGMDNWSWSLF